MAKKTAKSPINVVRDPKTISEEYGSICAKAGEAQFKIKALEADIAQFHKRLVELHAEHNQAAAEAQKRAQAEPTPEPTPEAQPA